MKALTYKITSAIALAAALAWAPAPALAQSFKAGFVNTDRILRDANMARSAQQRLEQEFSRREKEIIELGNSLQSASERFEREVATLSESQRTQRQRQLMEQDREFQRKRREFQEDLASRKTEELAAVLERANAVVQQVAESENYDVILQEAVWVNPKHDITDRVIQALNASSR
ncbi:membrane protein [Lampropedia cohaerens]|uniref:Membrane protein n=1 Tax=Lampropedia cohaerens TaxID=1610491 RepID=A0A0U1PWE1_9BURK|nr:OmpH family outer membrane protein [Lampropedia cohaerens]KKW66862.1 membrane protein [Lampropedia cohaerens]